MARWCFRRRAWVLVAWLALLVILGVTGRAAGSAYSNTFTVPGTGSTTALSLLAEDGRQALETYRREQGICLVLLDLTMPVMSGEETLRQLQAIDPDVCVLLSSGYNE